MSGHKCFISYHHADQNEAHEFVNTFDHERDVFNALVRRVPAPTFETLTASSDGVSVATLSGVDYTVPVLVANRTPHRVSIKIEGRGPALPC